MSRRWTSLTVAAVLVAAGCGEGSETVVAVPGGLQPTGMQSLGASQWVQPMLDGDGTVWLDGGMALTRLGPDGGATTWTPADDAVFANASLWYPASGTGVWGVTTDEVVRFDGTSLQPRVPLPDDIFGGCGITAFADGASALWAITCAPFDWEEDPDVRVVRWDGTEWVDEGASGGAYLLAVRDDGSAWLGDQWISPAARAEVGGGEQLLPEPIGIAPDPADGIWLLDGQAVQHVQAQSATPPLTFDAAAPLVGSDAWATSIAVTGDGSVWVGLLCSPPDACGGAPLVLRRLPDGAWVTFGVDDGLDDRSGVALVAAQGDELVVWDGAALRRFADGAFVPAWEPLAGQPQRVDSMVPVSDHEVWVTEQRDGHWMIWRWFDGRWSLEAGPWEYEENRGFWPLGAAASDGATWVMTPDGTTRFGSKARVVDGATSEVAAALAPGSHGRMALMISATRLDPTEAPELGPVLVVDPSGAGADLGVPPLPNGTVDLALAGDEVWAATTYPESALARWAGRWERMDLPAAGIQVQAIAGTDDGSIWIGYTDESGAYLARYDDGTWTSFASQAFPRRPLVTPGGSVVCAYSGLSHSCFDTSGPVAGPAALDLVPSSTNEVRVARDGSVWALGEDVLLVGQVGSS